jgi:hypothetical protein
LPDESDDYLEVALLMLSIAIVVRITGLARSANQSGRGLALRVMSGTKGRSAFLAHVGRWIAELFLVFLGAYAAFWLNNYQQHRQDAKRHDQILASLEQLLKEGIDNAKTQGAKEDRRVASLQRALQAGEMPPLHTFTFTTDYSATDFATLLQSGGIELLDVKTLGALRQLESVIRWGLSRMAHYQKLSDELIVPNLDQDISYFYDPATKHLRKRFEIYPDALQAEVNFFRELEKAQIDLLKQIQAERQRR